jgi:general stress protein CsbA
MSSGGAIIKMNTLIPIFLIPTVGFLSILFSKEEYARYIALITTIVTFFESLRL